MKKTPQEVYERLLEIKEVVTNLTEEKNQLLTDFYNEFEDFEHPIVEDKTEKDKYFRVYKPDGRFVYNIELDSSTRVKPLKIYKGE